MRILVAVLAFSLSACGTSGLKALDHYQANVAEAKCARKLHVTIMPVLWFTSSVFTYDLDCSGKKEE